MFVYIFFFFINKNKMRNTQFQISFGILLLATAHVDATCNNLYNQGPVTTKRPNRLVTSISSTTTVVGIAGTGSKIAYGTDNGYMKILVNSNYAGETYFQGGAVFSIGWETAGGEDGVPLCRALCEQYTNCHAFYSGQGCLLYQLHSASEADIFADFNGIPYNYFQFAEYDGVDFASFEASPPFPCGAGSSGSSGSSGDPHLHFAEGGTADFRGKNNTVYSILSAPGFAFNLKVTHSTFLLPRPRLVHGSFFTEAFWTLKPDGCDEILHIHFDAATVGFVMYNHKRDIIENATGRIWHGHEVGNLNLLMKQSTLYVRCNGWETNVTRKPIYNLVSGPTAWRIDLTMRPLDDTGITKNSISAYNVTHPHGLIGQSYDGDGIGISGKKDVYNTTVVTTQAMAEGSIEGTASDYELHDGFDQQFKYSRFYDKRGVANNARDISKLSGEKTVHSYNGMVSSVDEE